MMYCHLVRQLSRVLCVHFDHLGALGILHCVPATFYIPLDSIRNPDRLQRPDSDIRF